MNGSRWNATLVVMAIGLTTSCGSDTTNSSGTGTGGGNGGTTFSTGLAANKTLSSLTDDDIQAACTSLNEAATNLFPPSAQIHSECLAIALPGSASLSADGSMVSVDTAKCQMLTDECEADPVSAGVSTDEDTDAEVTTDIDCMGADTEGIAGCDATIGEYESCLNKLLQATQQLFASLTCANAETIIKNDGPGELDPLAIPECASFLDKCPDVEVPGQ